MATSINITSRHLIDIVKYRVVWLCITALLLLPGGRERAREGSHARRPVRGGLPS